MTKEELLVNCVEVMKTMSDEERGKLIADITCISLKLSLEANMSDSLKDIFNKAEEVA